MSTALVTGGASGIGAALVARLRAEGFEVQVLDLTTGFDVGAPHDWDTVDAVDVACLNAGVLGGPADPAELTLEGYRRAVSVNVDGVVLGVRRLARVMEPGGRIVCTASLAGLTAVPFDPLYAANKHAVVGLARSLGLGLVSEGVRFNAVCPGFAESNIIAPIREALLESGTPIIPAERVAEAVLALFSGEMSGECWYVQAGREPEAFRFRNLPGPRVE